MKTDIPYNVSIERCEYGIRLRKHSTPIMQNGFKIVDTLLNPIVGTYYGKDLRLLLWRLKMSKYFLDTDPTDT